MKVNETSAKVVSMSYDILDNKIMETKTGMNFERVLNCPSYFCEHVQTRSCPLPDVWTGETDWNGVVENLCVDRPAHVWTPHYGETR